MRIETAMRLVKTDNNNCRGGLNHLNLIGLEIFEVENLSKEKRVAEG